MGLRELKKEQTRQLIADTAWRLFADRGFDRVTVAEVAREAMVAPATVFNYFPTKEDLFFFRLEAFGSRLVEALGDRPEGEPALVAFRRHLLKPTGLLGQLQAGDPQALERLQTVNRMIAASPALQAREQRALSQYADALAELLAVETGAPADDVRARVAANALMGVQRVLIEYVRKLGNRAFALLERGLGDYAPKQLTGPARTDR
jgi:AcrR family transcriptional regulator